MLKIFILLILTSPAIRANDCFEWYHSVKLDPSQLSCWDTCIGLKPPDIFTIACGITQCKDYCGSKKCQHDRQWEKKMRDNLPKNWSVPTEKGIAWTQNERDTVLRVFDQLPSQLQKLPLEGIFRATTAIERINPATTSSDGKNIVVYDRAFGSPFWSTKEVVLHEMGHVLMQSLEKRQIDDYASTMGWGSETAIRSGSFVSSRAKDGIAEDFAENFSLFLRSRDELKSIVPKAYTWFIKAFGDKFTLKKECSDADQ